MALRQLKPHVIWHIIDTLEQICFGEQEFLEYSHADDFLKLTLGSKYLKERYKYRVVIKTVREVEK